jgi:four helix bundle protein
MRDWKKLRAFEQADELVLAVYRDSETWPSSQRFALTQQIQRAVVSIASNIVEGSSRASEREYLRFLEIAHGSACEAQYQLSVARRLGFSTTVERLEQDAIRTAKTIGALIQALPKA